jgi:hypothetical protein
MIPIGVCAIVIILMFCVWICGFLRVIRSLEVVSGVLIFVKSCWSSRAMRGASFIRFTWRFSLVVIYCSNHYCYYCFVLPLCFCLTHFAVVLHTQTSLISESELP